MSAFQAYCLPKSRLLFGPRGKLLNVREANAAQISANVEIQNIKQILGLQHGKVGKRVLEGYGVAKHRGSNSRHLTVLIAYLSLPLSLPVSLVLLSQAYDDAKSLRYGHLMIMTDQVRRRLNDGCAGSCVVIRV